MASAGGSSRLCVGVAEALVGCGCEAALLHILVSLVLAVVLVFYEPLANSSLTSLCEAAYSLQ